MLICSRMVEAVTDDRLHGYKAERAEHAATSADTDVTDVTDLNGSTGAAWGRPLPDPAQLATARTLPGGRGCAVPAESDGDNDPPSTNGCSLHCRDCGDPIPEHMHSARERGACSRCTVKAATKQEEQS